MTKVDRRPRVRGATTFLRLDLSQTPSLPQRGWVLRLTGCGHVDNASALPTGSTAHNSRHRRLLPRQFEARKPEFPPQFGRTRSRIVSETPTDSSEEAKNKIRFFLESFRTPSDSFISKNEGMAKTHHDFPLTSVDDQGCVRSPALTK